MRPRIKVSPPTDLQHLKWLHFIQRIIFHVCHIAKSDSTSGLHLILRVRKWPKLYPDARPCLTMLVRVWTSVPSVKQSVKISKNAFSILVAVDNKLFNTLNIVYYLYPLCYYSHAIDRWICPVMYPIIRDKLLIEHFPFYWESHFIVNE